MQLRFWIEMLALVGAAACALAIVIATLGAAAAAAAAKGEVLRPVPLSVSALQPRAYEGLITDAHCGAKHSADMGKTAGDCALSCVQGGQRFALVDGDKVYILEGEPDILKRVAGQRVKVIGTLNEKTISVVSVAAAVS